ncbi:DUF3570 domain-containing protein [Chitinophaga japonensis]|uniref:Uncharacterized protein DUF3570 n=1 Tax=Chitinophaga japonensis TaxID=104662 RepID=A0A562T3I9_CHIJA|nr:DUF3570 domain-containing protein [Chitinophaga japonensis]TWI88082.1 uncharacterized protein DUF3570 [Chitinophaga japonensis]
MKKQYLVLGLLATSLAAAAQRTKERAYKQQRVSRTDVQVLFSYYTQNGDHSAVTGGEGTETLQVYAPDITITHTRDSVHSFHLNAGVDVISSASTDKIDYVVSSASKWDARTHLNIGYSRLLKRPHIRAGLQTGFSIESDYFSVPVGLTVSHTNSSGSREISASLQAYFDDLRWGRLDPDLLYPAQLIYPAELRYREWFDEYRRNSYNLDLALYQVINERMQLAVFPGLVYQRGLLSTPFHRVYFNNDSLQVERLPGERWKIPLGVQLNTFVGRRLIIRSYYRFYRDNFGISAHTLQVETPVKVTPRLTLSPLARFYTQQAARYFRPYKAHDFREQYYTSDYDLSAFNSYKAGLGLRYAFYKPFLGNYSFKAMALRYAFYKRSDGLTAHMLTLLLEGSHMRMHRGKKR